MMLIFKENYQNIIIQHIFVFLQISNQTEFYDEMHRDIKLVFIIDLKFLFCLVLFSLYYNSIDSNQSYFPQSGEFYVAKSPSNSN
jgi:hypothetical protein